VIGLSIGGIPAVLLAAYVVKSLPLAGLRWGVVVVVLYAAGLLLHAALKRHDATQTAEAVPARAP
jgi:uncharacterized membrane protein YfcA